MISFSCRTSYIILKEMWLYERDSDAPSISSEPGGNTIYGYSIIGVRKHRLFWVIPNPGFASVSVPQLVLVRLTTKRLSKFHIIGLLSCEATQSASYAESFLKGFYHKTSLGASRWAITWLAVPTGKQRSYDLFWWMEMLLEHSTISRCYQNITVLKNLIDQMAHFL